ncbi:MAG: LacI family DNA-binding transcriptional regulator [Planctomycetes bacterium]|nr:LacI family DNA-binding transcriptional regulator [Planctomycetota bacterium]
MRDLAKAAGVSLATVSLALRDHRSIPLETRNRVLRAQRDIGYRLSGRPRVERPRSSAGTATPTLRSLVFILADRSFDHPTYAPVLQGVVAASQDADIRVQTCAFASDAGGELPAVVRSDEVDGIVLSGNVTDAVCLRLAAIGLPVVVAGTYALDAEVDQVTNDIALLGRMATRRHLAAHHRHIALLTYALTEHYQRCVWSGYLDALDAAGFATETRVLTCAHGSERALAASVIASPDAPTALVVSDAGLADAYAMELLARGREPGRDCEIVTLAGQAPRGAPRAYASLLIGGESIGRMAVAKLQDRLAQPARRPVVSMIRELAWIEAT